MPPGVTAVAPTAPPEWTITGGPVESEAELNEPRRACVDPPLMRINGVTATYDEGTHNVRVRVDATAVEVPEPTSTTAEGLPVVDLTRPRSERTSFTMQFNQQITALYEGVSTMANTVATTATNAFQTWVTTEFTTAATEVVNTATNAWTNWCGTVGSTIHDEICNTVVWRSWVNDATGCDNSSNTINVDGHTHRFEGGIYRPESAEEKAKRVARQTRERLKRQRLEVRAAVRAASLLKSILTAQQWNDWLRFGSVRIVGKKGIYDVGAGKGWGEAGRGWQGMIYRLDHNGEPQEKLCCHPPSSYPDEDRVAAVVLALRADEDDVLRKANSHAWGDHEKERVRLRRAHRIAA